MPPPRCTLPRATASLAALALLGAAAPVPAAGPAPGACASSHVWFVGAVYDPDQREDFQRDVDNFEYFLEALRGTYCIAPEQARILAFEDNYQRHGKAYPEASEASLRATLTQFAPAANAHGDSLLFLFLSSHGFVYAGSAACPERLGSFAQLKGGGGHDGALHDCELAQGVNAGFAPGTRVVAFVDCSLCGGFSDSLTPASGTVADNDNAAVPGSGLPGPGRVVMTGCTMVTECFGGQAGGVSYGHLRRVLEDEGPGGCDGWSAPGFPQVQGADAPVNDAAVHARDGRCTLSEWFFATVWRTYASGDAVGAVQQYRIKYGLPGPGLSQDVLIALPA